MTKTILTIGCLLCALTLSVTAAEGGKKVKAGKETKVNLRQQMLEKYDANKDGKIDKAERAAISEEDKAAMQAQRTKAKEAKEAKETGEAKATKETKAKVKK